MSGPWIGAFMALAALVSLMAVVVLGLLKRLTPTLEALESALQTGSLSAPLAEGLAPGRRAPSFQAVDTCGDVVSALDLQRLPGVILFMSPDCSPCEQLAAQFRDSEAGLDGSSLFVVMPDTDEGRHLEVGPGAQLLFQSRNSVSEAFKTNITPHAFAVDRAGVIVDQLVPASLEDLQRLAERAREGGDGYKRPGAFRRRSRRDTERSQREK